MVFLYRTTLKTTNEDHSGDLVNLNSITAFSPDGSMLLYSAGDMAHNSSICRFTISTGHNE